MFSSFQFNCLAEFSSPKVRPFKALGCLALISSLFISNYASAQSGNLTGTTLRLEWWQQETPQSEVIFTLIGNENVREPGIEFQKIPTVSSLDRSETIAHLYSNAGPDYLEFAITDIKSGRFNFVDDFVIGFAFSFESTSDVDLRSATIDRSVTTFEIADSDIKFEGNQLFVNFSGSRATQNSFLRINLSSVRSGDRDGDGLDDIDEERLGTDPNLADSDGDSIPDGQEVADSSDPLDPGSFSHVLAENFCSEWNGFFFGNMFNIAEFSNRSITSKSVTTSLYDQNGQARGANQNLTVGAESQIEVNAHDLSGWVEQTYGKVCADVANANPGDVDGRMVHYLPRNGSFDFAFSTSFSNGLPGAQFIPFNTFQPSLNPEDLENIVVNWIQVTNNEETTQTGGLYFYGQDGSLLGSKGITLEPGAREDVSGHQFSRNLVGMVEWRPADRRAKFLTRNVRYLYDNPSVVNTFDSAFQIEGVKGSGRPLSVVVDTRNATSVLEIGNATTEPVQTSVKIFNQAGAIVDTINLSLGSRNSSHIVLDQMLPSQLGRVEIEGSTPGSIVAVAMQYGRTPTLGTEYLYGIHAKEALGSSLAGSYNTYIGQGCTMLLSNTSGERANASFRMIRASGGAVVEERTTSIPAFGVTEVNLCAQESQNNYGVVKVEVNRENAVIGQIIRIGRRNDYRFPTPLR